jgi:hypothetical protein
MRTRKKAKKQQKRARRESRGERPLADRCGKWERE